MNAKNRRVRTRFAPDIKFEVTPVPVAPFRAAQEDRFERLKNALLRERLRDLADPQVNSQLRRAANEAAKLAWVTAYPLLVFPALFEEKIEAVLAPAASPAHSQQCSPDLSIV
jgi:hypothetical protein